MSTLRRGQQGEEAEQRRSTARGSRCSADAPLQDTGAGDRVDGLGQRQRVLGERLHDGAGEEAVGSSRWPRASSSGMTPPRKPSASACQESVGPGDGLRQPVDRVDVRYADLEVHIGHDVGCVEPSSVITASASNGTPNTVSANSAQFRGVGLAAERRRGGDRGDPAERATGFGDLQAWRRAGAAASRRRCPARRRRCGTRRAPGTAGSSPTSATVARRARRSSSRSSIL